ncbi:MAG: chromosome segregation protein SMC [Oscillospiraceae bacterium]|nr:chromosome segregation protein SMC [Oscillospiraceae bacterium]
MHLKYIEIQGFKSFPDKVRLGFEKGMTGIVGPNGSGKSNISDAVRWVLGEQSTKSLRGGKMEDVIFGGTQLRKPMGFAQVSLCLDNADGRIPDGGAEYIVTRRFYRSGDSEYLINGATVRLRDVREAFMDTGLGRDGYSIIGQGRIAEIVNARSDERREIFEEASGIAKYRFRKNEAQHRLEAAEDNLSRLRDILDELESRIGPLTEQSEKAKKFIALSDEKKSLEITYYCDTIERSRDSLRLQDDKIAVARQDYDRIQQQLAGMNADIDAVYGENNRLNADVERCNAEILSVNGQISATESAIAVLKNDIAHAAEQIETLAAERSSLAGDEGALAREMQEKKELIAAKKAEIEALGALIGETEKELFALVESGEQSDKARAEDLRALTLLQTQATDLRVESVAAQSTVESLRSRAGQLGDYRHTAGDERAALEKEKAGNDEYLQKLLRDIGECNNRLGGYTMKRDARAGKRAELAARIEKRDAEISELTHRVAVLQDMERSMEGFAPSVRRVIEAGAARSLRGIVGTVASLITIRKGCELAIETALGAATQNIVVENESCAKQAIGFLKETKAGRATFLPLDTIKPSNFDERGALSDDGVVDLASSLVECDARYAAIVSSLLGRIIVAEDLDAASVLARKLKYRYRIVTLDGQVINAGGSYTGGFSSRSAGIFSRKNEIEKAGARIAALRAEGEQDVRAAASLDAEISSLEAEMKAVNSDLVTLSQDRVRAETTLAQQTHSLETLGAALESAAAEAGNVQQSIADKTALIAQNDASAETLARKAAALQARIDAGTDGEALLRRRDELSALLSEKKIARVGLEKDVESIEASVEALGRQGDQALDRAANIDAAVARIREENEKRSAEADEKLRQIEALRAQAQQRRADIDAAVARRAENEKRISDTRAGYDEVVRQREDIGKESARLEERKAALQTEYDRAIARLWEEYELTRAEAEALCVPFASITELRQQVATLRARIKALGNVNVGAIEELEEVSSRYDFLSAQVGDVEKSKAELLRLIGELESEMQVIFTEKFNEINSHFRRVFVDLFGGGSANLSLSDEGDVLESGIELDVQPPGKVIKNLTALSGGEQALVAIALYFSILAVNPSPFCILDEIDSALDESNVSRFANYLGRVVDNTQIIAITHRRGTMEAADILYGVTMQEEGVSKVLKLGIEEAQLVVSK